MKYAFPIITTIDDVERHRASGLIHDAFKRGERRNGTVVYDHTYMDNHAFPPIEASPFRCGGARPAPARLPLRGRPVRRGGVAFSPCKGRAAALTCAADYPH